MTSIPENKRIAIIGGGTNTYISNHLALSAPSYGTTAKHLYQKFLNHSDNKMDVELCLTKMADPSQDYLDTPEDVEALVDELIADPDTRVIIFNVAMVDFKPKLLKEIDFTFEPYHYVTEYESFGKYVRRFFTTKTELILHLSPYQKVIQKIRKERKDILLVGFKTTCGATKEEQFHKGLKLCKDASANIVFVNDVDKDRITTLKSKIIEKEKLESILKYQHDISINLLKLEKEILDLQNNGLVTSEESSYWYNTRDEALDALVQMVLDRSHLHFTRSTVVNSETIPRNSEEIPKTFKTIFNFVRESGAYKLGPNIVFSKDIDPQLVINFINKYWDLSRKTDGLSKDNI